MLKTNREIPKTHHLQQRHLYKFGQALYQRSLTGGVLHLALRFGIVVIMPKSALAEKRHEMYRNTKPGPRVKMAARLYASGAVKSKKEACQAVGLGEQYLSMLSRPSVANPEITSIIGEVDHAIHDKTVALSAVIALAARRAVEKVNRLMDSNNEHIQLKAATDILDRNPETSKTQKVLSASFSIEGKDAAEIAAALVRSARLREKYPNIGQGDFIKIEGEDGKQEINLPRDLEAGQEAQASDHAASGPKLVSAAEDEGC